MPAKKAGFFIFKQLEEIKKPRVGTRGTKSEINYQYNNIKS